MKAFLASFEKLGKCFMGRFVVFISFEALLTMARDEEEGKSVAAKGKKTHLSLRMQPRATLLSRIFMA